MYDALVSLIRTYVPVACGAVIAALAANGVILDDASSTALTAGVTGLAIALYYTVARALESWHPWFGVLLGKPSQPTYDDRQKVGR